MSHGPTKQVWHRHIWLAILGSVGVNSIIVVATLVLPIPPGESTILQPYISPTGFGLECVQSSAWYSERNMIIIWPNERTEMLANKILSGRFASVPEVPAWVRDNVDIYDSISYGPNFIVMIARGWPFRCVRLKLLSKNWQSEGLVDSKWATGMEHGGVDVFHSQERGIGELDAPGLVPLIPIWKGVILNGLFFSFLSLLVIKSIVLSQRIIRLKRHRCPICSYQVNRSDRRGCPECGWNRPEGESKTVAVIESQRSDDGDDGADRFE